MSNRKEKVIIAIWLGCLIPFANTVQMTCDSIAPALGSNLTCICADVSVQGVVWWKGQLFLAACSSSGTCCPVLDDDYEFEVISSFPLFYMTILAYSYDNCGNYYCAGFHNSLDRAGQDISISDTPLDLTQQFTLSTPETNSTGNITVKTPCLFIPTITVQESIKAVWYKILNGTAEVIKSDETTMEFEDNCRDCTGVRARKMKATLFYKAPDTDFKGKTEIVEFVLRIFDQSNELNGQEISTVNKFILEIDTNVPSASTAMGLSGGAIVALIIFGVGVAIYYIIGIVAIVINEMKINLEGLFENQVYPHKGPSEKKDTFGGEVAGKFAKHRFE